MGRGDKKSKKGKQRKGSYGNLRNRKAIKARLKRATSSKKEVKVVAEAAPKPKRTPKKKAEA